MSKEVKDWLIELDFTICPHRYQTVYDIGSAASYLYIACRLRGKRAENHCIYQNCILRLEK